MKNKMVTTALSIAVVSLLSACGSDSEPTSVEIATPENIVAPELVEITAFDGYLSNALVYLDVNENGKFDVTTDTIYGLTDDSGKIKIEKPESGIIAVQTLVQGSSVQTSLAKLDSEMYGSVYTIDQDFPTLPVESEVVFSAPISSNVISPLTDLVVLEMAKSNVTEDIAIDMVQATLGAEGLDLYVDFVAESDTNIEHAGMHKTAQILAKSKADDPEKYVAKVQDISAEAIEFVETLTDEQMRDDSIIPVVDGVEDTVTLPSQDFGVNLDVYNDLTASLPTDMLVGDEATFWLTPHLLFNDGGQPIVPNADNVVVRIAADSLIELEEYGFAVYEDEDATTFHSDLVASAGELTVKYEVVELASDGEIVRQKSASFTVNLNAVVYNSMPWVEKVAFAEFESTVASWVLTEGVPFHGTLDASELWVDDEGDDLEFKVSNFHGDANGLAVSISEDLIITVSGTPLTSDLASSDRLYMEARDQFHGDGDLSWRRASTPIPDVVEAEPVPVSTNELVGLKLHFTDIDLIENAYAPTASLAECYMWEFYNGKAHLTTFGGDAECDFNDATKVEYGTYVEEGDEAIVVTSLDGGSVAEFTLLSGSSDGNELSARVIGDKTNDESRTLKMYLNPEVMPQYLVSSSENRHFNYDFRFAGYDHVTESIIVSELVDVTIGYSVNTLPEMSGYDVRIHFGTPEDTGSLTCDDLWSTYGGQQYVRLKSEIDAGTAGYSPYTTASGYDGCINADAGPYFQIRIETTPVVGEVLGITLLPSSSVLNNDLTTAVSSRVPKMTVNMLWDGVGSDY